MVELAGDRVPYIIQRGRWCHIFVLNVHTLIEDKTDDVKDSFFEEFIHLFDKFRKYHTKILLREFNAKVGREDIFKPTIGNEGLNEVSSDNGVRLLNFAHDFVFQIFQSFIPDISASHLTLFRLSQFISLTLCNYCSFDCFI
jgi:hypothetical protein